jgi:phosphoglycolate phosphatase
MRFKLVIFDLDGTLVDSSPDICAAINHAITPYGVPPITVDMTKELVGEGAVRLIEKVIEMYALKADSSELLKGFLDYYEKHLLDHTTVYPGVIDALEALNGILKAVVTNKHDHLSINTLQQTGLAKYFDLVVGSETAPAKKPSPLPILYVLEKFDIEPACAVIVGDSTYDIEAGKRAGIATVAVTYGYRSADLLQNADAMIDSMEKLPKVLTQWEVVPHGAASPAVY